MSEETTAGDGSRKRFVVVALDEGRTRHELDVEAESPVEATRSVRARGMTVIDAYEGEAGAERSESSSASVKEFYKPGPAAAFGVGGVAALLVGIALALLAMVVHGGLVPLVFLGLAVFLLGGITGLLVLLVRRQGK